MKKESITICASNQMQADKLRNQFNQSDYADKYRLNIIITGTEDLVYSFSKFLLAKIK